MTTDGGPTFPQTGARLLSAQHETYEFRGMTLRDYFAAQALVGFITGEWKTIKDSQHCASYCYTVADAMLAERDKT